MDQQIKIGDLVFDLFITEDEIRQVVDRVAHEIVTDYTETNPIMLIVLKGAFLFAADLIKAMDIPCEVHFVKLQSYDGDQSSGIVNVQLDIDIPLEGRRILLVEDIVDSGLTMATFMQSLIDRRAASVEIVTLLAKPAAIKHDVSIRYIGQSIDNDFVVGYGMDYDEQGRHLRQIYRLSPPDGQTA